jgi:arylsulfatase A-like enzyme
MSASERTRTAKSEGRAWFSAFGISLLVGAHAGLVDIALTLPSRPHGFASFLALFPPLLATATVFALLYLTVSLSTVPVAIRWTTIRREPAELALAAFLLTSFLLASWAGLVRWPDSPATLFEIAIAVSAAALVSVAAYFAWFGLTASTARRSRAIAFALASPFLLFELIVAAWAQLYHIESVISLATIAAASLLIGALVITLRCVSRSPRWAIVSLVLSICGAGGAFVAWQRLSEELHETSPGVEHDVRRVVLVSSDALRADALSSYDSNGPESPHLDELASDGVLFERAYSSAPWTLASLASILTGLSPSVHTLTDIKARLPDGLPTLAHSMTRAGYHTGAIVLNDLLHPRANLDLGFDDYIFLREPSFGASFGAGLLQRLLPRMFPSPPWPRTEDITSMALRWIEAHRNQDFFLWIHYYDPHAPFTPPHRYLPDVTPPEGMSLDFYGQKDVTSGLAVPTRAERQWIESLYRAEVRSLDDGIGALVDGLKGFGLYDDSLIVFTSDHGEEFWDHGAHGHGHTLYRELLAVPLIVKPPYASVSGRRVDARVSSEAVTPTILELCGMQPDSRRYSSQSLAPFVRPGIVEYEPASIVSNSTVLFDRQESVIFDGMKYVRSTVGPEEMLFDLDTDPEETTSLVSALPSELERGRALLGEHRNDSDLLRNHYGIVGKQEVVFDEDTLRKLRGLGYVQ